MPVVTQFHAGGPPLVMSHCHPIARTEALAQCGRSRATARFDGARGTGGDGLQDHVPATGEDCGRAQAVGTAHQELCAGPWPRMRALVGASGLPRTLMRRGRTIDLAVSAPVRDLAVRWYVLDADDVIDADTDTGAEGVDSGKPAADRRLVAVKEAGVGPARALVAGSSLTGRAGRDPGQDAVHRGAVPRTRRADLALGRRLEGHVGGAGALACLNSGAPADHGRYAPAFPWPRGRE
ncbi:hypothetical protein ACFC96_10675 [Streptomyces sp. NPDC055955]|uniref:hypothetical protein n=1 Tax=Streptomyces sp. NPDC055955 TaxID=3345665 RepID=UPI0035DEDCAE